MKSVREVQFSSIVCARVRKDSNLVLRCLSGSVFLLDFRGHSDDHRLWIKIRKERLELPERVNL